MSYKQRQNAMKRYFTYTDSEREYLQKPWFVTFQGEEYTVFTNNYSAVLTKEKCEDMNYVVDCEVFP